MPLNCCVTSGIGLPSLGLISFSYLQLLSDSLWVLTHGRSRGLVGTLVGGGRLPSAVPLLPTPPAQHPGWELLVDEARPATNVPFLS